MEKSKGLANFFQVQFHVGILVKKPEIIPLWPPVVNGIDMSVPICQTEEEYCLISSGNDNPNVFILNDGNANQLDPQRIENNLIEVPLKKEVMISVDRKYTGNEILLKNEFISKRNYEYDVHAYDKHNKEIIFDDLRVDDLSNITKINSNFRMEVAFEAFDYSYLIVRIDDNEKDIPSRKGIKNIYFLIEGNVHKKYTSIKQESVINNLQENILIQKVIMSDRGIIINVSSTTKSDIKFIEDKGYTKLVEVIRKLIKNGTATIGIIKEISKIRRLI